MQQVKFTGPRAGAGSPEIGSYFQGLLLQVTCSRAGLVGDPWCSPHLLVRAWAKLLGLPNPLSRRLTSRKNRKPSILFQVP